MAEVYWAGTIDGDMDKSGNWNSGNTPSVSDDIRFTTTAANNASTGDVVCNSMTIAAGGIVDGGNFYPIDTINNQGTINSGVFNNEVNNVSDINSGLFTSLKNDSNIYSGTFNGSAENNFNIYGGIFNSTVVNCATILSGTFNGAVITNADITSGIFNSQVTNNLNIHSGVFNYKLVHAGALLTPADLSNLKEIVIMGTRFNLEKGLNGTKILGMI